MVHTASDASERSFMARNASIVPERSNALCRWQCTGTCIPTTLPPLLLMLHAASNVQGMFFAPVRNQWSMQQPMATMEIACGVWNYDLIDRMIEERKAFDLTMVLFS